MTFRKAWRGVFALLFIVVTFLTLTPNPEDTQSGLAIARFLAQLIFHDAAFGDKVAHFLAYAALGGAATFADMRIRERRAATIVILAAYGAILEFLQGFGGVREAELADALANSMGALAAFPAALLFERLVLRMRTA